MSDHVFQARLEPAREIFPLGELAHRSAETYGENVALRAMRDGEWREWSYLDLKEEVDSLARWLIQWGIEPGQHVAILGDNSPEWEISYLAIQLAGAVCVPIDRMLPASGARHIIADSASRILFADSSQLTALAETEPVDSLQATVTLQGDVPEGSVAFSEALDQGRSLTLPFPKRELDDLAAILYTSGTTGHSKGVMLTSRNILSNAMAAGRMYTVGPGHNFLSVLPVHHSFEATAGFIFPLFRGAAITFSPSLAGPDIVAAIRDTQVTYMCGVPLLFEKMKAGILRKVRSAGRRKRALFRTVMGTVATIERVTGVNLGPILFRSLREQAGLTSVHYFLSAGGPLDPEVGRFFNRLGLKLFQGYGLTETSPCTHLSPPWKLKHECVGPPLPDVESRIDNPDEEGIGEVVVRGPNVFLGYYRNEEATRQSFTEDGWFRTGDLGFEHSDRYLQIAGRSKALIVTAGGKNVYPEEIEFLLQRSDYIAESVVIGIPRSTGAGEEVGALVHPDQEQLDQLAEERGTPLDEQELRELIGEEIRKAMEPLASYKRLRAFTIHENEFEKTTKRTIKRHLYDSSMIQL